MYTRDALKFLKGVMEDSSQSFERREKAALWILSAAGVAAPAETAKRKSAKKRLQERTIEQELMDQSGVKKRQKRRQRYLSTKTNDLLERAAATSVPAAPAVNEDKEKDGSSRSN